ncbi:F-box domain containing protein [Pandoravirus salinus]|uniref:F-box domain containing protein n=1 Tax=Pandoravirus salinus TaxID=1349410 RepID=S4VZ89_9VIRU|nr:F-box domain [Pandoravirus salinus]AGO85683.1 F-box domain containing protein [Pandoravirus salinus]
MTTTPSQEDALDDARPACHFDALPQEIICGIFGYIATTDGTHLARAALVCRQWRLVSQRFVLGRRLVVMPLAQKDVGCCASRWRCPIRWKIVDEPACRRCKARQRLFQRALECGDVDLLVWMWRFWPRLWLWLACEDHGEMCKPGREAIDLKMRAWSIAAGAGSVDCMRWLASVHWKRHAQDDRIVNAAARGGHSRALVFLHCATPSTRRCRALALAAVNEGKDGVQALDWLPVRRAVQPQDASVVLERARRTG